MVNRHPPNTTLTAPAIIIGLGHIPWVGAGVGVGVGVEIGVGVEVEDEVEVGSQEGWVELLGYVANN